MLPVFSVYSIYKYIVHLSPDSTGVLDSSHVVRFTVDIWSSHCLAPVLDARGNFGVKAGLGLAGGSTVGWTLGEEEHYVTIVA